MQNNNRYYVYLVVWFVVAFLAGYSGILQNANPPIPQILLFTLVILLVVFSLRLNSFRNWICSIPISHLIAVHLTRFVGFYFLVLYEEGRLPHDFAVYGGWGDIVVAFGALILLIVFFILKEVPKGFINAWNIVGLLDILFVVVTAGRLAMADPSSMAELLKLPLSLLPTFLVPIIIFTHLVIGYRLIFAKGSD